MSDPRIFSEEWSYDEGVDNFEGRHPRPPGHHDGPVWDYPDRLRPPEYPFGHGSRPNWQPGYVPSATEWQSWFSRKYDTDDPTLSGGPFIPLGGGVMQGPLRLYRSPVLPDEAVTKAYADSLTPANGPFVDANGKTPFTGDVTMYRHLQVAGDIYADCGLTVKQDTRLGQSLYVQGYSLLANNLDVNADVTVANVLYIGPIGARGYQSDACPPGDDERALRAAMWGFYVNPDNGARVQSYTNGYYDDFADGWRHWHGPVNGADTSLMQLDPNGNLQVRGITISSSVTAIGGPLYAAGISDFIGRIHCLGGAVIEGLVPGSNSTLLVNGESTINGRLVVTGLNSIFTQGLVVNVAPGLLVGFQVNGDFECFGDAFANSWQINSDARLKRDIAPAQVGLEQILQLQPKSFIRGTGGRELGLIAQEVQEVLPEAVSGTDTLSVGVMPVLTALIGAVQELDRKLEILATK